MSPSTPLSSQLILEPHLLLTPFLRVTLGEKPGTISESLGVAIPVPAGHCYKAACAARFLLFPSLLLPIFQFHLSQTFAELNRSQNNQSEAILQ